MEFLDSVVNFLDNHGFTTILLLALADFVLGVAAAVHTKTFKWYYVGDILRKTGPMLAAFFAVKLFLRQDEVTALIAAGISADLLSASLKNLIIIIPTANEKFPFTIQPPSAYIANIRNRSPN